MPEIDVSRLLSEADPFDLSASVAERGTNAGPETWANATAEAESRPLDIDDRDAVRDFFRGFGAWEAEEIAAWADSDLDTLVLQYAAGDLRELQSLRPGDGPGGIDWAEAESLSAEGTVGGRLFTADDRLFIYIGD